MPILESSNTELLSHRGIFYNPFANEESKAQRHVVADLGRERVGALTQGRVSGLILTTALEPGSPRQIITDRHLPEFCGDLYFPRAC